MLSTLFSNNHSRIIGNRGKSLSLFFATCCIIDLFGVFPVIALPRAIIECGWIGIPLAIVIFYIQVYTAIMLGRCWIISESLSAEISRKKRYPYAAMAELAFGRVAGYYVNALLGLAVFGGSVPNLLVAAQNLELIGLKVTTYKMDIPYCYWIIILGVICCPIMWIGSPKDLKWLGLASVFIVLTSSVLTWVCLLESPAESDPFIPNINWTSLAIAYGILAFQFDVHPMILTVQMDMKNKNQLGSAIISAFVVSGSLFLVTTVICYCRLGTSVHYNALQGLPPSALLYVVFVLATVQIGLSTVVGASPLFQGLEDFLNIGPGLGWRRCLLRTGVVVLIVLVGEVIPRFDLIMSLIGGLLMGQLMFLIPPILYSKLRYMQLAPAKLSHPSTPRRLFGYGTITQLPKPEQTALMGYHSRADLLAPEDHPDTEAVLQQLTSPRPNTPLSRSPSIFTLLQDFVSLEKVLDRGPLSLFEKSTNFILVFLGLTATGTSTYFAISGTLKYADFAPPCITNVTLASRLIYHLL